MKHFVCHDDAGQILWTGSCPDEAFEGQRGLLGTKLLEVAEPIDATGFWVEDGALAERPAMPLRQDGLKFSRVPKGATVGLRLKRADEAEGLDDPLAETGYTVEDGKADIRIGLPGTYVITFRLPPYLPARFEVTVP